MTQDEVQDIPLADSINNDAFEAVVETYYQTEGYITSSGKWFWVWEAGKRQRGYQDIDVLAIDGKSTVIISVTSNLDDKVNTSGGVVNDERVVVLMKYFQRAVCYLSAVPQYQWLVGDDRKVRYVVAYNHAFEKSRSKVAAALNSRNIETISASEMLKSLVDYAKKPHLKIQNPLLRTIQLIGWNTFHGNNTPSIVSIVSAPLPKPQAIPSDGLSAT